MQQTLTEALSTALRVPIRLTVAGRTDAGVHAAGQVAHCDVPAEVWATGRSRLRRRLAGMLPTDVRVRAIRAAPAGFDARFAALWRRYGYRVDDAEWGVAPLRRHDTVWWQHRIDDDAVRAASQALLGLHDFAAFCRRREGRTTVRTLAAFDWTRDADGVLIAAVRADAFCHSMVRSLVGCVLAVGEGRRDVAWAAELLTAAERSGTFTVAPAHGLTLLEVGYPPDDALAARTRLTRAVRPPVDR